jgi:hypothetical protein
MARTRLDIRRTGVPRFHHFNGVIMGRQRQDFCRGFFFIIFIDFKLSWCMVFSDGGSWFFVSLFPAFSPRRDFRTLHLQAVA